MVDEVGQNEAFASVSRQTLFAKIPHQQLRETYSINIVLYITWLAMREAMAEVVFEIRATSRSIGPRRKKVPTCKMGHTAEHKNALSLRVSSIEHGVRNLVFC